jgi:tRNA(fMet)-specific endonuclease VapC
VKYILDTNAVSALMRGDAAVVQRLSQVSRAQVGLPQPVVAEISYGIERLPRSRRRDSLLARFDVIRAELPRAPWSDQVSEAFGDIKARLERAGKPVEDFDVAIAAHARAANAVLVTANTQHMGRIPGVVIEDWSASR